MILEQPHSNECADEWCQHVDPDALATHVCQIIVIIKSYLVDGLCEAQSRVQTGTRPEREFVAYTENVGESQCFQEEVASLGILVLPLCQGQVEQGEEASLQDFLTENSGELESQLPCVLCVPVQTVHSILRIKLVTLDVILRKQISQKKAKEGSEYLD